MANCPLFLATSPFLAKFLSNQQLFFRPIYHFWPDFLATRPLFLTNLATNFAHFLSMQTPIIRVIYVFSVLNCGSFLVKFESSTTIFARRAATHLILNEHIMTTFFCEGFPKKRFVIIASFATVITHLYQPPYLSRPHHLHMQQLYYIYFSQHAA